MAEHSSCWRALLALRIIQILQCIISIGLLAGILADTSSALARVSDLPAELARDVHNFLAGTLVPYTAVSLSFMVLGLIVASTLLFYTVSSSSRARASCCRNNSPCRYYTVDMCCDIALTVLFIVSLILSSVGGTLHARVTSAVLMILFAATAILCYIVGKEEKEATHQLDKAFASGPPKEVGMV